MSYPTQEKDIINYDKNLVTKYIEEGIISLEDIKDVKDKTFEVPLVVTLEDILMGRDFDFPIPRKVFDNDGTVVSEWEEPLRVSVKPGTKSGTKLTLSMEGSKHPGRIPADLVFIIEEEPHPTFVRDGNNIIWTCKIPFRTALSGSPISVPTLEGKIIQINFRDGTKKLKGHGLPYPDPEEPHRRGDLLAKIEVVYPDHICNIS